MKQERKPFQKLEIIGNLAVARIVTFLIYNCQQGKRTKILKTSHNTIQLLQGGARKFSTNSASSLVNPLDTKQESFHKVFFYILEDKYTSSKDVRVCIHALVLSLFWQVTTVTLVYFYSSNSYKILSFSFIFMSALLCFSGF